MPNHNAKRGMISGWSMGAARRNRAFLYSVNAKKLSDTVAYAFTLTVRDCPPTPKDWARAVERFFLAMRHTHGCVRLHWIVEWQKRQVPHLHGCMFFEKDKPYSAKEIILGWCYIVQHGSSFQAQTVKVMNNTVGWMGYLDKHAARGVKHYQRSGDAIPLEWQGRTGRMWGHQGSWPVEEPRRLRLDGSEGDGAFYPLRRLARNWRCADARREVHPDKRRKRILLARRMLKCPDPKRSSVRGVSEWIPNHVLALFEQNLLDRGYSVLVIPRS